MMSYVQEDSQKHINLKKYIHWAPNTLQFWQTTIYLTSQIQTKIIIIIIISCFSHIENLLFAFNLQIYLFLDQSWAAIQGRHQN